MARGKIAGYANVSEIRRQAPGIRQITGQAALGLMDGDGCEKP